MQIIAADRAETVFLPPNVEPVGDNFSSMFRLHKKLGSGGWRVYMIMSMSNANVS
jgi:hypothetical protein